MLTRLPHFLLLPARLRRLGLLLAGLLTLAPAAQAQVGYSSVAPAPNAKAAPRGTNVVLVYNQAINPATASRVGVFSQQAGGRKASAYSTGGSAVTVNPNVDFKPGETVLVTAPATVTSTSGTAAQRRVYQFTTQAGAGPGTFGNGSEVRAGDGPVALGDLDGDGDLDMVGANYANSSVSVRFNQGGGTFTGSTELSLFEAPQNLALADVDNDGDLDILVTGQINVMVRVLLNQGGAQGGAAGTFVSGRGIGGTYGINRSLAVGDLNGDGNQDFITANSTDNTLSVRLNAGVGGGAFNGRIDVPVGASPSNVTLGDVDGDGDLDALVATSDGSAGSSVVRIFLNNGQGTFAAGTSVPVSGTSTSVALGDLDGDGDLDLAAPSRGSTVSVRLNQVLPTITSFAPVAALPGAQVVITGTRLSGATSVRFNSTAAAAFTVNSATQVTATVPSGATSGPLSVTTPVATATSGTSFTVQVRPQVTSLPLPSRNSNTAARATDVELDYNRPIDPATAASLRVFSQQAGGRKASAYSTNNVRLTANPAVDFKPGETVFVSAPATVLGTDGGPAVPYVFQFTTAVSRGLGTFRGGSEVAAGTLPQGVALADVDNDGDLDALVANGTSNSVSVRLNQGGTYGGTASVAVGAGPASVVAADLDADGDLDLLTANASASTVSVRLNQGGTFAATGQEVAVVATPTSVAVGDLDGDGDLDLVAANSGGSLVSVRLNNGAGTFTGSQSVVVGSSPRAVVLADVDNDGDLDILAANSGSSSVSVRLNQGGGTFGAGGQDVPVAGGPVGLAVTDANGDGNLDLVTANGSANSVSVRLSQGGGTFAPTGQDLAVGTLCQGVALGDLDGDGGLDLLATNGTTGTVSVRPSNGPRSGTFATTGAEIAVGAGPRGLALGDVDGDGDLDLLTANSGSSSVSVRLNQAPAPTLVSFAPDRGIVGTSVVITGTNFTGTQGVSFNGQVAPGFVVNSPTQLTVRVPVGATTGPIAVTTFGGTATSATPFTVTVAPVLTATTPIRNTNVAPRATSVTLTYDQPIDPATAPGVRVFSQQAGGRKASAYATGGNTVVVDPNTDFRPGETVFVSAPATVRAADGTAAAPRVWQFTTQAGAGGGTFGATTSLGVGSQPNAVATGDVDGDGDLDLLTANGGGSTVSVRLNQGTGTFSSGSDVGVGSSPTALALGDVDGDGDLDLLTATSGNGTVSVRLNQGGAQGGAAGTFGGGSTLRAGTNSRGLALGDLDADGDLDLVVTDASSGLVGVYLNSGPATFTATGSVSVGRAPYGVGLADVDDDGDLDLLTANLTNLVTSQSTGTVSVRLNQGSGTFANTGQDVPVGLSPLSLALGDVDGDGDLDVVAANSSSSSGTGTVSVRLNQGGTFGGSQEVAVGNQPTGVALGDVDGDGDLDLLTANNLSSGAGTVSVRFNQSGLFAGGQEVAVGTAPYGVVLGDLDGDGDLDALAANSGSSSVSVLLNQLPAPASSSLVTNPAPNTNTAPTSTSLTFTYPKPIDPATAPGVRAFSAQAGGRKAASVSTSGNTITLDPNTDFRPGETVLVTAPVTVRATDGTAGPARVFQFTTQAGAGSGTFASASTLGVGSRPSAVATGDVDNDGDLDILTANAGGATS